MRQAKLLVGEQPNKTWLVELRKLERQWLRIAVGWLTGHWKVNYYLSKLGLCRSVDCRWCHVEKETTEQLLCKFLAWVELRHKILGFHHVEAGSRSPDVPREENQSFSFFISRKLI